MDLRRLIEAVEPDVSMFPTPAKVRTQIDLASQAFILSDLTSVKTSFKFPRVTNIS